MSPPNWPVGRPMLHFLNWWLICEDPAHCRSYIQKQTEQDMESKLVNNTPPWSPDSCLWVPALTSHEAGPQTVSWNKLFPPLVVFGHGVVSQQQRPQVRHLHLEVGICRINLKPCLPETALSPGYGPLLPSPPSIMASLIPPTWGWQRDSVHIPSLWRARKEVFWALQATWPCSSHLPYSSS